MDRLLQNSYVSILLRAQCEAQELGVTAQSIRREALQKYKQAGHSRTADKLVKKHFQAYALHLLVRSKVYNQEHVMCGILNYWSIKNVPSGILTRRAIRYLHHAFKLVPVKVVLVLFRTWFNGWCTARRFQIKNSHCLLGCTSAFGEDSIQHYAHCPVVISFAQQRLSLPASCIGGLLNFLCLERDIDDDVRVLQLLLLFAVYNATNCIRYTKPVVSLIAMSEFLLQYLHQGASQMSSTQKVVHNLVTTQRRVRPRIG